MPKLQISAPLNVKDDGCLHFLSSSLESFPVNKRLIAKRKRLGQQVFEESEPICYLDSIDVIGAGFRIRSRACKYEQMFSLMAALEEETMCATKHKWMRKLKIRDASLPNLKTALQVLKKPFPVGCSVVTALDLLPKK